MHFRHPPDRLGGRHDGPAASVSLGPVASLRHLPPLWPVPASLSGYWTQSAAVSSACCAPWHWLKPLSDSDWLWLTLALAVLAQSRTVLGPVAVSNCQSQVVWHWLPAQSSSDWDCERSPRLPHKREAGAGGGGDKSGGARRKQCRMLN